MVNNQQRPALLGKFKKGCRVRYNLCNNLLALPRVTLRSPASAGASAGAVLTTPKRSFCLLELAVDSAKASPAQFGAWILAIDDTATPRRVAGRERSLVIVTDIVKDAR